MPKTVLNSKYADEIPTFSLGDDQMEASDATAWEASGTVSSFICTQLVLRTQTKFFWFSHLTNAFRELRNDQQTIQNYSNSSQINSINSER